MDPISVDKTGHDKFAKFIDLYTHQTITMISRHQPNLQF